MEEKTFDKEMYQEAWQFQMQMMQDEWCQHAIVIPTLNRISNNTFPLVLCDNRDYVIIMMKNIIIVIIFF